VVWSRPPAVLDLSFAVINDTLLADLDASGNLTSVLLI
jgi:hypothetical protein